MSAYLSTSLSESVHASVIIQAQERQRQAGASMTDHKHLHHKHRHHHQQRHQEGHDNQHNKDANGDHQNTDGAENEEKELSLLTQILLTMAFAGIEMSNTFSVLYNILFQQYLGVPTSLVSLSGVLCGAYTVVTLPVIGILSDRGPNPVIRKLKLMLFGLVFCVMGFSGIIFCSATKFHQGFYSEGNKTMNYTTLYLAPNSNLTMHVHLSADSTTRHEATDPINFTAAIELKEITTAPSSYLSEPVVYVGIVSFAFLDISFDSLSSLTRAFVLECAPPRLHTRLLLMAASFGSISGTCLSFVGTFDLAVILGSAFQVDGTPATMLVFSCFILTFVVLSFLCTSITGYLLSRRNTKASTSEAATGQGYRRPASDKDKLNRLILQSKEDSVTSVLDDDSRVPLLSKNSLDKYGSHSSLFQTSSVQTIMESTPHHNVIVEQLIPQKRQALSPKESESYIIYENKPFRNVTSPDTEYVTGEEENGDEADRGISELDVGEQDENKEEEEKNEKYGSEDKTKEDVHKEEQEDTNPAVSPFIAALRASHSMSMSMVQSFSAGEYLNSRAQKMKQPEGCYRCKCCWLEAHEEMNKEQHSIFKNKKLMILSLSLFFTMGTLLSFSMYSGNTLTLGVYHGDPQAAPRTQERQLYVKGLRNTALGLLLSYLTYATFGAVLNKAVDQFGQKLLYMVIQFGFGVSLLAFFLVKMEWTFFVATVTSGVYRTSTYTLAYVMANDLAKEQPTIKGTNNCHHQQQQKQQQQQHKKVGQVMVLVGFLLPCHYLLISLAMGPLISATGSVWVPVIYGTGCAMAALLTCAVLSILDIMGDRSKGH